MTTDIYLKRQDNSNLHEFMLIFIPGYGEPKVQELIMAHDYAIRFRGEPLEYVYD